MEKHVMKGNTKYRHGMVVVVGIIVGLLMLGNLAFADRDDREEDRDEDRCAARRWEHHAEGLGKTTRRQKPAPPPVDTFGKTLSEWQRLYWTWALGGSLEGQVDDVLFMPIPQGVPDDGEGTPKDPTIFVGELDVMLTPDTAFVMPVFVFIGESYAEKDEPDDPSQFPAKIFTNAKVLVKLDNHPLINSRLEALSKYFFPTADPDGAVSFDPLIPYYPPQPRGSLNADAALWVKGLGFVYPPLSVGEHTLTLFVDSRLGFGFCNTWHITVQP
jgi:hypothetical protein